MLFVIQSLIFYGGDNWDTYSLMLFVIQSWPALTCFYGGGNWGGTCLGLGRGN